MTGLPVPALLVASHIIPWSVSAASRLNPRNGLCLSALHNRAFDQGLLKVHPDLTIQVSPRIQCVNSNRMGEMWLLGLDGKRIIAPERFAPDPEFLNYHRKNIFQM